METPNKQALDEIEEDWQRLVRRVNVLLGQEGGAPGAPSSTGEKPLSQEEVEEAGQDDFLRRATADLRDLVKCAGLGPRGMAVAELVRRLAQLQWLIVSHRAAVLAPLPVDVERLAGAVRELSKVVGAWEAGPGGEPPLLAALAALALLGSTRFGGEDRGVVAAVAASLPEGKEEVQPLLWRVQGSVQVFAAAGWRTLYRMERQKVEAALQAVKVTRAEAERAAERRGSALPGVAAAER